MTHVAAASRLIRACVEMHARIQNNSWIFKCDFFFFFFFWILFLKGNYNVLCCGLIGQVEFMCGLAGHQEIMSAFLSFLFLRLYIIRVL